MKIILLSGHAQAGKDTTANYLKKKLEEQGKVVIIDRFAKYIKMYLRQMGWDGVTKDSHYRNLLQKLGTEVIKQNLNYKCFHAKRLCEDIQILDKTFNIDYILVSDARFRDEVYTVKSMFPDDCITVRINRLGFDNGLGELKNHISETDLDNFDFDYTVYNQSLGSLYDETDRVLGKVLGYKER